MTYSDQFYILSTEMAEFLRETSIETLVTYGFKVGTAVKVSDYTEVDLVNTTIRTLRLLICVIEKDQLKKGVNQESIGQLSDKFEALLEEMIELILSVSPNELVDGADFSSSTVSNIRTKGLEGNYQTSKLLLVANNALRVRHA